MIRKKVLVSALLATGAIGAVATPLTSMAQAAVYLNIPPPVVYEIIPAPRRGSFWSSGRQDSRHGNNYHQPRWVENNGRWDYQSSRWDTDRDGVPNRHDRAPNDPRRN